MNVTVESTGALERRMRVEVPIERIETEVDTRLKSVGRTARIKGFRPGKIPAKVVRQHYGKQVRQEVVGEIMQKSYSDAVMQEKLRPAGGPKIEAEDEELDSAEEYDDSAEEDPVEIKLRRVRELRDKGDEAALRQLLYEILAEGDEDQRKVARNILEQLDS